VRGAKAIGALASPVRQELIDTVDGLGGAATIAELAAQLGRPADGLYYHVRQLVRAGLLVAEDGDGAEQYRTPGRRALALDYRPDDPASARAVGRVAGSMLRIARRDFDAALAIPGVVAEGPRRALWAARAKGWVSRAELREINALLARLVDLVRRPRDRERAQLVSLCFVLAPIEARPSRRAANGATRAKKPRPRRRS